MTMNVCELITGKEWTSRSIVPTVTVVARDQSKPGFIGLLAQVIQVVRVLLYRLVRSVFLGEDES
ncbi:unnamed protein product [Prunus brigantina]